eukprot:SAG11_NODE_26183_length_348_cov_1.702811_1_plen_46_part_10
MQRPVQAVPIQNTGGYQVRVSYEKPYPQYRSVLVPDSCTSTCTYGK